MDFSRLSLARYKAYRSPCEVEIRPITLLVGANNAGKSALARAICLLAGGLQELGFSAKQPPLPLSSFGLIHGDSLEELIAGRSVHGSVALGADFRHEDQNISLRVNVQNVVSPGRETQQIITKWLLRLSDSHLIEIERVNLDANEHQIKLPTRVVDRRARVDWSGLIPRLGDLHLEACEQQWVEKTFIELSGWAKKIRYLQSPRQLVASPFHTPSSPPAELGITGHEAPLMLASSDDLLRRVQKWFEETFDIKIDVKQQGDTSILEVQQSSPGRTPIPIAQAGQGLSQVLPVAIQCISAHQAGPGVDILEHPEAELHPRAHAAIAELIVDRQTGQARPIIVETHSELLLLRIRRKVAQGKLAPKDVAIYWIDRDDDTGSAVAQRVEITTRGEVSHWPEGVFQEDYKEVVAMRREARSRDPQ